MFSEESNYIENVKKPENIAKNRVLEIIFSQFYPGDTIDNEDNICDIEENLPPAINPEVKPCRFPSYRTILKGVGGVILVMLVCAHLHGIALNKKSHNSFGETSSFDIRSLNDTPSDLMDTLEEIATNDFCEKDGVTIGDGKKGKKGKEKIAGTQVCFVSSVKAKMVSKTIFTCIDNDDNDDIVKVEEMDDGTPLFEQYVWKQWSKTPTTMQGFIERTGSSRIRFQLCEEKYAQPWMKKEFYKIVGIKEILIKDPKWGEIKKKKRN